MTDAENIPKRSRGGRGLKAQYPTTTVRVPEVLKQSIQDIVCKFYNCDNNTDNDSSISAENEAFRKLTEIDNYITTFKDNNKVTKSKVKLHELITGLEVILNTERESNARGWQWDQE